MYHIKVVLNNTHIQYQYKTGQGAHQIKLMLNHHHHHNTCLGLVPRPKQSSGHSRGREPHGHQRIKLHLLLGTQVGPGVQQTKGRGRRGLHRRQGGHHHRGNVRREGSGHPYGREDCYTQSRTSKGRGHPVVHEDAHSWLSGEGDGGVVGGRGSCGAGYHAPCTRGTCRFCVQRGRST